MSKRKGLTVDEKKTRLIELFYEKKEFFQLKELEKIASKEKGIVSQTVKDILQSLVDDGLVDTDKIGTSIYYWAFKSKAKNARINKLDQLQKSFSEADEKLKIYKKQLDEEKNKQENLEETNIAIEQLEQLKLKHSNLAIELKKYSFADPEILQILRSENETIKEAANMWIENVFTVRSWCIGKFNMMPKNFDESFGIPEDFDYL